MFRKTLVFLLLCSASMLLFAQLGKGIKGKVLDREGKPVIGTVVTFVDQSNIQNSYQIKTDKDGIYLYAGLPFSTLGYKVSVKVGDLPEVSKVIKVKTLEIVELNFDMKTDLVAQETRQEIANPAADAQELFKNEDFQGAVLKADEALSASDKTNEKVVLLIKARSLEKLNRSDEELQTYLKFQELYPKSDKEKEVFGRIADIYDQKGDKANAEKYKKLFKDLGGLVIAENYNEGVTRLNQGDAQGAADFFKKAITDDANDPDAHRELARALAQLGDYGGAVEHLKLYLKMKPSADDADQWNQAITALEPMVKGSKK
jgi:tetratricopeptide (TPR) repeat protein